MKIPDEKIQEITDAIDIVEVIGQHVTLKRYGNVYKGLCPFHNEKTPSFNVNPEKKFFYCFGCNKGGSVFRFLMDIEGITFREAAEKMAEKGGVALVLNHDNAALDDKSRALRELYTKVAGAFHYLLNQESETARKGRDYLKVRGISPEMQKLFMLGWAPEERQWLYNFLIKKNFSASFLKDTHLFSDKYPRISLFWNRIVFPIRSPSGQVIGFGGRAMSEGGPKYINSPESDFFKKRHNLYGLDLALSSIRKEGEFVLVEGYFDVIALFQAGITRAVAPLGTAFTDDQAKLMRRYANRGILVFDGDAAGARAVKKTIQICEENDIQTQVVIPPAGSDPADILQKEGPQALHNLLKFTINSFDYLVERALEEIGSDNPEGKLRIIQTLAPFIGKVDSSIRRESMIRQLSDVLEIDFRSIEADLRKIGKDPVPEKGIGIVRKPITVSLELYLMMAVAANREQFSYVRGKIQLNDLVDSSARALYIYLEDSFRTGKNEGDSAFLDRIEEEDLKQLLTRKLVSGEFEVNPGNVIRQSLLRVKRESLIRSRTNLERELSRMKTKEADSKIIEKLLADKMFIDVELGKLREASNDGNTE